MSDWYSHKKVLEHHVPVDHRSSLQMAIDAALKRVGYLEGELKNCQAANNPLGERCVVLCDALRTVIGIAESATSHDDVWSDEALAKVREEIAAAKKILP